MSSAFEGIRTISASDKAKTIMKQLVSSNIFDQQRNVWTMGASLGISQGKRHKKGKWKTFQNVNSLDPEGIFSAIMIGLYPDASPEERVKIIEEHAEWGIREIFKQYEKGTLDFSKLGK